MKLKWKRNEELPADESVTENLTTDPNLRDMSMKDMTLQRVVNTRIPCDLTLSPEVQGRYLAGGQGCSQQLQALITDIAAVEAQAFQLFGLW